MTACLALDVLGALEQRYNPPSKPRQYATFREVPDATERRRIDFLAVNLWQSRGRIVDGVEVKVNRPDWLKELRNPKADSWFGVCDHWWLAAPQGVVQPGELPKTWGFLECRAHSAGWRMYEKVPAPDLDAPPGWPTWLLMRLLARVDAMRDVGPREIEDAVEAEREKAAITGDEMYQLGLKHSEQEMERGRKAMAELDRLVRLLGLQTGIADWQQDRRAVQVRRAVQMLDMGNLESTARLTARMFREAAASIEAALPISEETDG